MDPVTAIGLASSILTFIDIGYKVVTGTLETAKTGQAAHTEHIDVVAHDLEDAVAHFSGIISPGASGSEKALQKISVKCQALSRRLVDLLKRFKVPHGQHGNTWDHFRITIRRMRKDSEVQEIQTSLVQYRSQVMLHLLAILNDRQLATQIQVGKWVGEIRTDLSTITTITSGISDNLAQTLTDLQSTSTQSTQGIDDPLPGQKALLNELESQFQEVKHALGQLAARCSEKTPETRILENIYFGQSMFQREETLKFAEETTFRWLIDEVPSGDYSGGATHRLKSRGFQKAEVASRFQNWLQSGSGVFHISGKAGSGKSTLMKLILSTQRTHELLREWASDKQLLFARFYFWSGGDQMQNSLEGLQRSILFEVLFQQPDLVREVFSETYSIVAHNSWESPIDSRFFTPSKVQKAFKTLLRLPTDPRHRLCLFIDGLDEYGADVISGSLPQTQREDLAQSLVDWASNTNVKILASSRPYPEFNDTFSEDQRLHLHQLTHDDMTTFGRHLFERHRTFGFPGVQEGYQSLIEDIVSASDGVFLWTGLTIQRMLGALARRDRFESLSRQLEATPRELNLLYEKMFSEIDENDRNEAMKMMLLVSEARKHLGELSDPGGVNAMAISWLESMEDPGFPLNQPSMMYSNVEIEEKRRFAESRVNGYTQGLLEVITDKLEDPDYEDPYLGYYDDYEDPGYEDPDDGSISYYWPHKVQFFHRTAMEYVAASSLARNVMSHSPNLFNVDFYVRLALAELHFGPRSYQVDVIDGYSAFDKYIGILKSYLHTSKPSSSLIDGYRAAIQHLGNQDPWNDLTLELNYSCGLVTPGSSHSSPSFYHWIAHYSDSPHAVEYLAEKIRASPDLARPDTGLSLLLAAACRGYCEWKLEGAVPSSRRLDRVQAILAIGGNLNHSMYIKLRPNTKLTSLEEFSVWQIWCLYYVTEQLDEVQRRKGCSDLGLNQILEAFIQTGVDSDCDILMGVMKPSNTKGSSEESLSPNNNAKGASEVSSDSDSYGQHEYDSVYVVSLGDFIRQIEPGNYDQLERLLGINSCMREFSPTYLGDIEAELAAGEHSHFSSPTVRPLDLKQFYTDNKGSQLQVYWIRWKNSKIPGNIGFRIY